MKQLKYITVLAVALLLTGCYGASHLRTSYIGDTGGIKGTFDVVYYGARYADDPGSIVVLDVAGDGYKIEPFALEQSYSIETGLPVDEALKKGIAFLKQNKYYDGVNYNAIYSTDGNIIGYEMMPEYEQTTYVSRKPISVTYFMRGSNTVKFLVQERFSIERDFKMQEK